MRRLKIALLHDSPLRRQRLCSQLEYRPYIGEIESFGLGGKALEVVKAGHVDVLITDILLMDMDGIELLEMLRSASPASGIKVIVLAAIDDPNTVREALELGAACYMVEPCDSDAVYRRILLTAGISISDNTSAPRGKDRNKPKKRHIHYHPGCSTAMPLSLCNMPIDICPEEDIRKMVRAVM